MFIGDLDKPITTKIIGNIIRETFEFELSENELTPKKAKAILEDICVQIADFRNGEQYFLGERNSVYLSMLATAKYLTEYLREKKTLTEAPPVDPKVYHKGIQKGIGHGLDTTTKFVPHVAGSALGAFVGGLKGQALSSEHGRINVATINLDKEIDKHFGEYKDPKTKKVIKDYMTYLQKEGAGNQKLTPQMIQKQIADLPGHPFKGVTNPAKATELVTYFTKIYTDAQKAKTPTTADKLAGRGVPIATTKEMKDVASALMNLGYKKPAVGKAIMTVVNKDSGLSGDFDALFKAAQEVIQK